MKKETRIDYLFNMLRGELKRDDLKMDYNSYYGGYRIDVILEHGAEAFFDYANRITKKEMICYLEGVLKGLSLKNNKQQKNEK